MNLTNLRDHFSQVQSTVSGIASFTWDMPPASPAPAISYPLLRMMPSKGESALSGTELNQGFSYEQHRVTLELSDVFPESEPKLTPLNEKLDALQGFLSEFLQKAFAEEYRRDYQLAGGLNNIRLIRGQKQGRDLCVTVTAEFDVRLYAGASAYTSFTACPTLEMLVSDATDPDITLALQSAGKENSILDNIAALNSGAQIVQSLSDVSKLTPSLQALTAAQAEAGITLSVRNSLNKIKPRIIRLGNHYTLLTANAFGNLARFTDHLGNYYADPLDPASKHLANGTVTTGSIFAAGYVIDHSTGYGWYNIGPGGGTFTGAQTTCAALSIVVNAITYDDFFLPEVEDVIDTASRTRGFNFLPMGYNSGVSTIMTNTTYPGNTALYYQIFASVLNIQTFTKTTNASSAGLWACRIHYM